MQRRALVQVKVTEGERQRWHEAAEREERTLSELIREAMRDRLRCANQEEDRA